MRSPLPTILLLSLTMIMSAGPTAAVATEFDDVADDDRFSEPISWLLMSGLTRGCNPPANTAFCPDLPVTRGQLAAFLTRSLDLDQPDVRDYFTDDDNSIFEAAINDLAANGITRGCNPPDNTHFCPNKPLTREQMAALLVRGFGLTAASDRDFFDDDNNSIFEGAINTLAQAGITVGCNPPASDRFCPEEPVNRAEMAAFLWRLHGSPWVDAGTTFVAAGDIARCDHNGDEATALLVDRLLAARGGVVAALGDTVYPEGSAEQFAQCYEPSWGRHREHTRPAVGNHEYRTPGAAGYFAYFGAVAGDPGDGWYGYTVDGWKVVVLNSNCDRVGCSAGSPQEQWLREELSRSPHICTVAYMHHPRFSSGAHGNNTAVADLWAALADFDVELVLAGHDHNYERLAPMSATGIRDPAGLQSFVVGTGGTHLRSAGPPHPASEVLLDRHHGVLQLDLGDGDYRWQFIDIRGAVHDHGSRSCG